MDRIGIIGTGFVADLYMRSLATFPQIEVTAAYDIDGARLSRFCSHWKIRAAKDLREILDDGANSASLILNLTNPSAHFEVSRACLEAGKHVYSEKPLAMNMSEARALHALAKSIELLLASAPC
jgi:predicted dehydrogenase